MSGDQSAQPRSWRIQHDGARTREHRLDNPAGRRRQETRRRPRELQGLAWVAGEGAQRLGDDDGHDWTGTADDLRQVEVLGSAARGGHHEWLRHRRGSIAVVHLQRLERDVGASDQVGDPYAAHLGAEWRSTDCFFGHLFNMGANDAEGSALWNTFEELWATTYRITIGDPQDALGAFTEIIVDSIDVEQRRATLRISKRRDRIPKSSPSLVLEGASNDAGGLIIVFSNGKARIRRSRRTAPPIGYWRPWTCLRTANCGLP